MSLNVDYDDLVFVGLDGSGGEIFHYQGQPFTGFIVEHYSNGQLSSEEEFKNGYRDGVQRSYYDNGQKKEEYHLKFGRIEGSFKRWDINGNITFDSTWVNGNQI